MEKSITQQIESSETRKKRTLKGVIISDKMDKTVVVKVSRIKLHSKYSKSYKTSQNFKAHDEKNEYHTGDEVVIEEIKPMSKDKRWRVVSAVLPNQDDKDKEVVSDKKQEDNK
ncbi:MAG: 30S ribosomal protein S17 [Candidatus Pacebacteria bacterium]|jgi:small subunit ribosomal protein S17|nr:30S ribosomal protein S17 [Candidatus Paceibacterota bacterium]MDD5535209.1 30S ribosomal protein S17 [Candidatus Paceibacterota bacterium]